MSRKRHTVVRKVEDRWEEPWGLQRMGLTPVGLTGSHIHRDQLLIPFMFLVPLSCPAQESRKQRNHKEMVCMSLMEMLPSNTAKVNSPPVVWTEDLGTV